MTIWKINVHWTWYNKNAAMCTLRRARHAHCTGLPNKMRIFLRIEEVVSAVLTGLAWVSGEVHSNLKLRISLWNWNFHSEIEISSLKLKFSIWNWNFHSETGFHSEIENFTWNCLFFCTLHQIIANLFAFDVINSLKPQNYLTHDIYNG